MSSSRRSIAAISIGLLLAYYEVYRWVPLGRWNWAFQFPVQNDQFYPDLVIGALLAWFCWSFARARRAGMATGAILLSLWVVLHCFDWWLPYARSLPANAGRYSFYRSHTQILPAVGDHYPPDAGHAVLDLILFPTCILAIAALAGSCGERQGATAP